MLYMHMPTVHHPQAYLPLLFPYNIQYLALNHDYHMKEYIPDHGGSNVHVQGSHQIWVFYLLYKFLQANNDPLDGRLGPSFALPGEMIREATHNENVYQLYVMQQPIELLECFWVCLKTATLTGNPWWSNMQDFNNRDHNIFPCTVQVILSHIHQLPK
jgi:hypothetical protein